MAGAAPSPRVRGWVTTPGAAGHNSWERCAPRGVCPAALGSLGVGGLLARSLLLRLIYLWTLLSLLCGAAGTHWWPADGVGEGMALGAPLALDGADKLQSLLSEGAASPPPQLQPCTDLALCFAWPCKGRGRQITALREQAGLLQTWVFRGAPGQGDPCRVLGWPSLASLPGLLWALLVAASP